ncbi:hypothetical protein [Microbacterium sp. GXF6406]
MSVEYPLRDRPLNADELEALRLMLSTFRDGSGQVILKWNGESMPGFRDFERATAAVTYGYAREDKGIFDVWVPTADGKPYGISCKMASLQPAKNKCSFMELSNSAAKFHAALAEHGVVWRDEPARAGKVIIDLVMSWHEAVADEVDLEGSRYAVLDHDARWNVFSLKVFPLDLRTADPVTDVEWIAEGKRLDGWIQVDGRRHRLWQWYADSGGQLKYYPPLSWGEWSSGSFTLEQPDPQSLRSRAIDYFPDLWPASMAEAPEEAETDPDADLTA